MARSQFYSLKSPSIVCYNGFIAIVAYYNRLLSSQLNKEFPVLDMGAYISVSQSAEELSVYPETVRRLLRQDIRRGSKVGTL